MKELKTKTYKTVGYSGYTTVFIPTNKRVETDYENGKAGDQLWHQLTNDGLLTGNLWTEQEILRQTDVYEMDNPRDGYSSLISKLLYEIYSIELSIGDLEGLPAIEIEKDLAYLSGQKKAIIEIIKDLKK